MLGAYSLATIYSIAVAILCLRRGEAWPWLWIILFTGPLGATIYLALNLGSMLTPRVASASRPSGANLRRARADAERLDTAAAWAQSARVHADRGRHAEAIADARRALAKAPDELDARYDLGRSLAAAGRAAEAVPELSAVVAADPDHALGEGRFLLARSLRSTGERERALSELRELGERSSRADFLFELATLEEELGNRAEARAAYGRIVDEFRFVPKYLRGKVRPWVWKAKWRLGRLGEG